MEDKDINAEAPEGQIYVCAACGKTSPTRSGFDADDNHVGARGWDASCFMHAVLCYTIPQNGQWVAVETA